MTLAPGDEGPTPGPDSVLAKWWQACGSVGIEHAEDPTDAQRTRFSNYLSVIMSAACLGFAALYAALGQTLLMWVSLVFGAAQHMATVWLHRRGHLRLARVVGMVAGLAATVGYAYVQGTFEASSYLALTFIAPSLYMLSRWPILAGVVATVPVVTFIVMRFLVSDAPPLVPFDDTQRFWVEFTILLLVPVVVWFEWLLINRENRMQHQQLREFVGELRRQVAAREQMAAELSDREARLRSVMDNAVAAIVSMTPVGAIESFNPAAEQLFGHGAEEVLGRDIGILLREPWQVLGLRNLSSTQARRPIESIGVNSSGQEFPVEVACSPHQAGGEAKLTLVVRDLTHQRENEATVAELSRQAGMAEVATDVLHSVGNTLQSVMVSAGIIDEVTRRSRLTASGEVLALLEAKASDELPQFLATDARGRRAIPLLSALHDEMVQENTQIAGEVERLLEKIEHIKRVVAAQQTMAVGRNVVERVNLEELLEVALDYQSDIIVRQNIAIRRDYQSIAPFRADQHRLLQILMNLVKNAREAIGDSGVEEGILTVSVREGPEGVCVSVEDNGIGMDTDTLERIFQHGFTTKAKGHGFGLHGCAIHAEALGGSLSAQSDGRGKGARFELRLPVSRSSRSTAVRVFTTKENLPSLKSLGFGVEHQ